MLDNRDIRDELSVKSGKSHSYKDSQVELLNMSKQFSVDNISIVEYDDPIEAKFKAFKKSRNTAIIRT